MEAEFAIEYSTPRIARSVLQAFAPDNQVKGSEIKIQADVKGKRLKVSIKGCDRVETLEATVQDIFRCIRAAELSLSATSQRK